QRRQPGEFGIPIRSSVGGPGDDQWGAGFVDQNRVDLVNNGEVVAALDAVFQRVGHVVAQVVEAEFIVGAVGDVGGVGDATLVGCHLRQDHADVQAQEAVQAAHPLAVTVGEVG